MKVLMSDKLTRSQVDVIRCYIDLNRNGYITRVQHFGDLFWYIRLKHAFNGNEILLRWESGLFSISKNGKVVKQTRYDEELISG